MFTFIKELFSRQKGKRTVVIFNDDGTERSSSYRFKPRNLWILSSSIIIGIIVVVIFLVVFTPLGGFVYNQRQMRESVIAMQKQVAELQESVKARNMQLYNLRQAVFSGEDSLFSAVPSKSKSLAKSKDDFNSKLSSSQLLKNKIILPENAIAISSLLNSPVQFPVAWPVEGTVTRDY